MIIEVVAVGTELLLGQIVNSNAAYIGAAIAARGHDAHYQQVVGDNLDRLTGSLQLAMSRSDAVIITGGIGPTQDDLTREALCAATGREMVESEEYAEHLRRWFEARGRTMSPSNLRQAQHPEGAELLPNPRGTAPGLYLEHDGVKVFCVPGVPAEMEHLIDHEVMPRLDDHGETVLMSRLVRLWGRPESEVAELLNDLYVGSTNPSIAFLAGSGEIKVRITVKAADAATARALIEPMEKEIRSRLGDAVFGADDETAEKIVLDMLRARGWTIATAESMTAGLVAASLTAAPGASDTVRGGVVTYWSESKGELLGVSDITRVVDATTAAEMAEGARRLFGAEVAVSVTGEAGPEPAEKPVGTVFIGVSTPERTGVREMRMPGDRERIRSFAVTSAIHLTRLAVSGKWW
ncbi:MAG TPA: competence/damage-inducible protein A [Acidimicrobiia bacterium]|nr:competence/damage-inducible protein A [Acidimicrobiia bacterium]